VIDVKALTDKQLKETQLEILVFGPAVDPPSTDPYVASFQAKRREIKQRLIDEGHSVAFGEDIFDPTLPAHLADPLLQEIVAMKAADLIIILVGSPGAIAEAKTITSSRDLCQKAAFYCFDDHKAGLVAQHLQFMSKYGSTCSLVSLPAVQACHLTTTVLAHVRAVQIGKAFLF